MTDFHQRHGDPLEGFAAGWVLKSISDKLDTIMGALDDLKQQVADLEGKVDNLQATIDSDQASDAAVVQQLTEAKAAADAEIARLQAIIDAGNTITPQDLADIQASLAAIGTKVDAASADVAGPNG